MEFGVTAGLKKQELTIVDTIKASSKRTVGIMLDLQNGKVHFWVNGKVQKKNKDKKLSKPGLTWYPIIRFTDKNAHVTLNPFCSIPQSDSLFKLRTDFTYSLIQNITTPQVTYISSLIGPRLLVCGQPKTEIENVLKEKIQNVKKEIELQVTEPALEKKVPREENIAVVTFKSQKDLCDWQVANQKNSTVIKVLDSTAIAKLIVQKHAPNVTFQLGFDTISTSEAQAIYTNFGDFLKAEVLGESSDFDEIVKRFGLKHEKVSSADVNQLKQACKDRIVSDVPKSDLEEDGQKSGVYSLTYLSNTDRLLATRGNQLKVFA